jgi:hypothetical protein
MGGRISVVVGLDFDDPSANSIEQQRRPDQIGGDLVNAAGEKRPVKLSGRHRCCGTIESVARPQQTGNI